VIIKIFPTLPAQLANAIKQFERENFYAEGERTAERLAEQEEKYFSPPKAWLLAFEDNQIIGQILLHRREIAFDNRKVVLGGIGGVCTHKNKRKQGIATAMLKKAMTALKEWGCDVAYLCTNPKKTGSLYSQIGFVSLGKSYTYYGRSGRLYEDSDGMIAPVNSIELFEEVLHSKQILHLGTGNW